MTEAIYSVSSRTVEAWNRCCACGIPQAMLFGLRSTDGSFCSSCAIGEMIVADRETLAEVVEFFRERYICAYCGERGDEVEHVIPRRTNLPTWTVIACHECNSLASGTLWATFAEKRDGIRARLRRKYRRLLQTPEWDDDELRTMGPTLRKRIRGSMVLRDVLLQRLAFDLEIEGTFRL